MPPARLIDGRFHIQCVKCTDWFDEPLLTFTPPPQAPPMIQKPGMPPTPAKVMQTDPLLMCTACFLRSVARMVAGAPTQREAEATDGAN